jgi:perosamine synthetase
MIPIAKPNIRTCDIEAVTKVMESGNIASGKKVLDFEHDFSDYINVNNSIAVNNGTTALHASLLALGIKKGDEVIVPDLTFVATASAIMMCGAKPVFCDVDKKTYNISFNDLNEKISLKTRAVIGVHLFGQPFDVQQLMEICEDEYIYLIEDACQAHGATYDYFKVGGFGTIGCFSFYATKNMTTGEGGMITTNDNKLSDKIRRIINHGQSQKYMHDELGYNYRMTDMQAAMGITQLRSLEDFNMIRMRNAAYYNKFLDRKGIIIPFRNQRTTHVYHQYAIQLTKDFPLSRDKFIEYMHEKGIGTAVHYPIPLSNQPMFNCHEGGCINSENLSQSLVSLPVHPLVSVNDLKYICDTITSLEV